MTKTHSHIWAPAFGAPLYSLGSGLAGRGLAGKRGARGARLARLKWARAQSWTPSDQIGPVSVAHLVRSRSGPLASGAKWHAN